jgi:hypothetical protein
LAPSSAASTTYNIRRPVCNKFGSALWIRFFVGSFRNVCVKFDIFVCSSCKSALQANPLRLVTAGCMTHESRYCITHVRACMRSLALRCCPPRQPLGGGLTLTGLLFPHQGSRHVHVYRRRHRADPVQPHKRMPMRARTHAQTRAHPIARAHATARTYTRAHATSHAHAHVRMHTPRAHMHVGMHKRSTHASPQRANEDGTDHGIASASAFPRSKDARTG